MIVQHKRAKHKLVIALPGERHKTTYRDWRWWPCKDFKGCQGQTHVEAFTYYDPDNLPEDKTMADLVLYKVPCETAGYGDTWMFLKPVNWYIQDMDITKGKQVLSFTYVQFANFPRLSQIVNDWDLPEIHREQQKRTNKSNVLTCERTLNSLNFQQEPEDPSVQDADLAIALISHPEFKETSSRFQNQLRAKMEPLIRGKFEPWRQ